MPRPKLEINPVRTRPQTRVRLSLQVYDAEQQYYRAAGALVANLAAPAAVSALWDEVVRATRQVVEEEA